MTDQGEPLLVGTGLGKAVRGRLRLQIERIELLPGRVLAVFGPNGAGKSTLLHILAMLLEPDSGRVEFRGDSGRPARRAMRAASAVVFQRSYFWRESVEYNVGLGLQLRGVRRLESQERARAVFEQLRISHLRTAHITELSVGERQRVALARALVLDPEILFLDEPTSRLDTRSRADLRRDLERAVGERPTSVLLVTQDRNEAFRLADRVGVLIDGRLVQLGTPTEIYEDPVGLEPGDFSGAELTVRGVVVAAEGELLTVEVGEARLVAIGEPEVEVGQAVKVSYRPEDLIVGPPDFADGGFSSRNLLYATVTERRDLGQLARLRLEGPVELIGLVTRRAADELAVGEGTRVSVHLKATALRAAPTRSETQAPAEGGKI